MGHDKIAGCKERIKQELKCRGWSGLTVAHPSECWEGLLLHLHTALESGAWLPASGAFLARKPHFSAVLEKQKSAKEKTARQSEGTKLLEDVGTVPAEVAE